MKNLSICFLILLCTVNSLLAKEYKLTSPDGKIILTVSAGTDLKWSATFDGKEIISSVNVAMILGNAEIPAENEPVKKVTMGKVYQVLEPVIAVKHSKLIDNCNTMKVIFKSGNAVQFRAYNDGIAYRFETALKTDIIIKKEVADIQFPAGTMSWYPLEESMMSHNERIFIHSSLDTIGENHLASLPALFVANGINVLFTESDIEDYPGMWIRGARSGKITGIQPKYPDAEKAKTYRDIAVTKTRDYIAQTIGTRTFPWRVFIVSGSDGGLIENELVYKLAKPSAMTETEWIKPGKVAWDWWNANNVYGVDFRAGINNETYKYYIDFASENGIEYVILDEGWYKTGTVLESVPEINIPELCKYAESRNVGIILWVVWKTFDEKLEEAAVLYEKWGVKGVKVDFMQRDDQPVVNFYQRAMQVTADHHLLIDFHGAYKPDGAGRTFPNALTREGVKGLENCKWSKEISPDHNLTLPFTRMVAGPMDYTPGAMVNMDRTNFYPQFTRPSSQGTRAHQMALYVIFESPLQMLADSPSNYRREKECTDFIVGIPVVWDDLKVIEARIGDYLILARRSGNEWFIGALTDWTGRDFEIDLSFLPSGNYSMTVFKDGINADRYAQDFVKSVKNGIKAGDKIKIHMAPGGGWVARLTPGN